VCCFAQACLYAEQGAQQKYCAAKMDLFGY